MLTNDVVSFEQSGPGPCCSKLTTLLHVHVPHGHVERSKGAVKRAFGIQVGGKHGPGRPKMTWKQLTERDCREWKLLAIDPHDRDTWRPGVRPAMCAASQLPDVDIAPVPAR